MFDTVVEHADLLQLKHSLVVIWTEHLASTCLLLLSAGDKDQFPILSIQYHSTSCLELSVSNYEKHRYHHRFQGTPEN